MVHSCGFTYRALPLLGEEHGNEANLNMSNASYSIVPVEAHAHHMQSHNASCMCTPLTFEVHTCSAWWITQCTTHRHWNTNNWKWSPVIPSPIAHKTQTKTNCTLSLVRSTLTLLWLTFVSHRPQFGLWRMFARGWYYKIWSINLHVYAHTLSLFHTHTHTHALTLSLSLSLTHTHTHATVYSLWWDTTSPATSSIPMQRVRIISSPHSSSPTWCSLWTTSLASISSLKERQSISSDWHAMYVRVWKQHLVYL